MLPGNGSISFFGFSTFGREAAMLAFLFTVAVVAAVVFTGIQIIRARYRPQPTEDEIHFATTADGWRIALHRYRPRGDDPHGEPVLLHHGVTANAAGFDMGVGTPEKPVPSLAHWLAERGYEVWAIDLRGRAASQRAGIWRGRRWNWSVDEYINFDDPAAVDFILTHSTFRQMHWIGHSMGGILLLCHAGLFGSPRLASGVAVASGLNYRDTGSAYQPLIPLRGLAKPLGRFPTGFFTTLLAPLMGRGVDRFEGFNYYPPNIAPRAARAVNAGVINDISAKVFYQLASMFSPSGLTSLDGGTRYEDLLPNVTTPLLLVAGDRDQQASTALAERTLASLPGDGHRTAFFGPAFGHSTSYGHFDLVAGIHAEQEVYPVLLEWLQSHRAAKK